MSKQLSDTQLVILSAACQRDRARVLPITASLKGGAGNMVLRSLHSRGLIEAVPAEAGDEVWTEQDGAPLTLRATQAAFEALGIDPPAGLAEAPVGAPVADSGAKARRSKTGGETAPRQRAPKLDKTGSPGPAARTPRSGTKQELLIGLLRHREGASLDEIIAATGWQPHTVRGAIAGALKKRLGLEVVSEKVEGRGRVYRIAN
jgi:hypothetical protein